MTFGDDQRIEFLERGLCEVATILAGMAPDRATFARLQRITDRYDPPEQGEIAPWLEPSPTAERVKKIAEEDRAILDRLADGPEDEHDDLSGPARPA